MKKPLSESKAAPWIMLILGLIAYAFSNGHMNIPVASWIWPFCILFYFRKCEKPAAKLLPLPLMLGFAFIRWSGVGGGSLLQEFLLGFINGIVYYLPFLADSLFYKKAGGFKATLILPLSFASLDFFMSLTPVACSDSLAASQAGNLPLMQLASVAGVYGITFLIAWFASAAMYAFEHRDNRKSIDLSIKVYAAVMALVLAFGGARLAFSPTDCPTVKMAMSTGIEIGDFNEATETLPVEVSVASMEKSVKTAAESKAELIEFNEEAFTVFDTDLEQMLAAVKRSAAENNIAVLIGLEIEDTDSSRNGLCENKLYLVSHEGNIVFVYDKAHLVPVVETNNYIKGDGKIPNVKLTLPGGGEISLAAVICMDSAFPGYIRDGVNAGTQVCFVPAWDWKPIDNYQDNWVIYRSVENGFTTMYCTYDGLLTTFDQYGRSITRNDTDSVGFENVIVVDAPVRRVPTLYKACGFILDWCFPAALLLLIASGFTGKRARKEH